MRLMMAAAVVVLVGATAVRADDPTGTWKWEAMGQGGQTREMTLTLKLEDGKLTGSMPGRNNQETKIEDASFKDGEVKFTVTRERNNMKTVSKYTLKLDGDTLKGKVETARDGQEGRSRDFEAKRAK